MVSETLNIIQAVAIIGTVWLTWHVYKQKQKYYFAERQLNEFYSPMLALRLQIKALSDLRVKIENKANQAWQEKCSKAGNQEVDSAPYEEIVDYHNLEYKTTIRALYRAMQKLFLDNIWLAEPETLEFLNKFVQYNETQDRILTHKLPSEVYRLVEVKEETLEDFYNHLKTMTERLKKKMK
jgi:hypothetical protein